MGAATVATYAYLGYEGSMWALDDIGPSYPQPEYVPGEIQSSNLVGGSTTVATTATFSVALIMPTALESMGAHLGFMFGSPLNGFPDPNKKHDPKNTNDIRTNAKHIKNSLEGIQKNLKNGQTLVDYFQNNLNSTQLNSLTSDLDSLIWDLQNQGYLFEQIGQDMSTDILQLLADMGYPIP